jgi:hypothetical protein
MDPAVIARSEILSDEAISVLLQELRFSAYR